MKIAKGEKITVDDKECTITKVAPTQSGILNVNKNPCDKTAITPMVRIYYTFPDGKKAHADVTIPATIEVVLG